MMKSLEPITKQVQDLKGCMSQCVDDVESLSMVDLLQVVNEIGKKLKTAYTRKLAELSSQYQCVGNS
jgi:hypothetical protein